MEEPGRFISRQERHAFISLSARRLFIHLHELSLCSYLTTTRSTARTLELCYILVGLHAAQYFGFRNQICKTFERDVRIARRQFYVRLSRIFACINKISSRNLFAASNTDGPPCSYTCHRTCNTLHDLYAALRANVPALNHVQHPCP